MKTLRKVLETITEKLLMASGYITSITIILMVVFLFREGAGLFNTPDIEEGYVLAVNRENPVQKLSPQQVMQVFDGDIASWGSLGWGGGDSIRLFRLDDITAYATPEELGEKLENVPQCLSRIVASHKNIIAYLPKQLIAEDFAGRILDEGKITPASFLGGKLWYPTAQPAPQFGVLPLILGTLWVSIAAILIALPFGLAVAIYMAELAGHRLRNLLKPVIELLAGIPSVVYGLLRTGRDRPARAAHFLAARRRNRTGRGRHSGDYGIADDHYRSRRRYPQYPAGHEGVEPGTRRDPLADNPQSGDSLLDFRHHCRGRTRYRPRIGRNDGRADGHR